MTHTGAQDAEYAADLRLLFDQLDWDSAAGCYRRGRFFHCLIQPMMVLAADPAAIIFALRPLQAAIALPFPIMFVLRSDQTPHVLHYGHLNRIGQAQIHGVVAGRLRLRRAPHMAVAQGNLFQGSLPAAWPLDARHSAFAADAEPAKSPILQHAAGDPAIRVQVDGLYTQVLVTAQNERWADALIPLAWERSVAGDVYYEEVILPLVWHRSLDCWAGRVQLSAGSLTRLLPPHAPLDYAALAGMPPTLIRFSVQAAASVLTRRRWHVLSADPALPAAMRAEIRAQLGEG